jgi:hypothetical protein
MCSACSGSVMRPTAAVGMLASVRMAEAKGTWKFGCNLPSCSHT